MKKIKWCIKVLFLVSVISFVPGIIFHETYYQHIRFEKTFGIKYPKTNAEIEAARPFIIHCLHDYWCSVTNYQVQVEVARKQAESLPATSEKEVWARTEALKHADLIEYKNLNPAIYSLDSACAIVVDNFYDWGDPVGSDEKWGMTYFGYWGRLEGGVPF